MRTPEHSFIGPRRVAPMSFKNVEDYQALSKLGICLDSKNIEMMAAAFGMDTTQSTVLPGTMTTPVQFLQSWLPGFVNILTAARKIDELVGIATVGSWEDEEVVQGIMEPVGKAAIYGDLANIPLSSWNNSFERRTVMRFEEGLRVGKLEEARAAKMGVSSGQQKRDAAAMALEIQRNAIGFYGFNNGANRTYGFLNDPSLPAYVTVAATGTGSTTTWSTKSYVNIVADIRSAMAALRTQSQDTIDLINTNITLAVPTNAVDFLSVVSDFGNSVQDWLDKTYPKLRVISAPELNNANGGANVFYLYPETVSDSSTDDGRVFTQIVPAKFQLLGVQQLAKGYEEDYSNATAGVLCKRPYAVVRRTGI